ncbi:MAG: dehydrogenase, partial [Methanococcoides sp.]|nr:dehydrogenase [Methanococcoides sp.]
IVSSENPVYKLLYNRYYQHQIFVEIFSVKIIYEGLALASFYSDKMLDWLVNGTSTFLIEAGDSLRKFQTGVIQDYAAAVVAGVGLLVILVKLIMEVF